MQKEVKNLLNEIKSQNRVCIFIDNSNLFWALRGSFGKEQRLDYVKLKEYLSQGNNADIRFYYSVMSPDFGDQEAVKQWEKSNKFYEGLEDLGYILISLPLRERTVYEGGITKIIPKEKGLDCEIVYDMATLSRTGNYKTFILVAGDEDYARTIKRLRKDTGIEIKVAFFDCAGCSNILTKESSVFLDLSKADIFRKDDKKRKNCA